mgnify:CR=1 FL=1
MSLVIIQKRRVWRERLGSWYMTIPKFWAKAFVDTSKKSDEVIVAVGRYIIILPKNATREEIERAKKFLEEA